MILPNILKTIWCMNIILWDYESVWHNIWPQIKCRSLWPTFNGALILPYILKTIWCMNIILWDYESVWLSIWPQNKLGYCDLYYMVWWFCLEYLMYEHHTESVLPDVWPQNKCRSLLPIFHGPVILSWIFDVWTSYCGIMSQYYPTFDLKINVGHCDLYFMV